MLFQAVLAQKLVHINFNEVSSICDEVKEISYQLTKDEFIVFSNDKEIYRGMYKNEDKKIYYRLSNGYPWEELGLYQKGSFSNILDFDGTITAYYKK